MAAAADARRLFTLVRKGIDARAIGLHVRKPFRFLLCGDPALVNEMRALLLSGHDDLVPPEAAACLETIRSGGAARSTNPAEVRAVIFLGRRGDVAVTDFSALATLKVPIFAVTVESRSRAARAAAARGRHVCRVRGAGDLARRAARTAVSAPRRERGRRRDRGRQKPAGAARHGRGEADARRGQQRAEGRAGERGGRSHSGGGHRARRVRVGRRHGGDHGHPGDADDAHRRDLRPRSRRAAHVAAAAGRSAADSAGARWRASWPASFPSRASPSRARSRTPARSSSARASRSSTSTGGT